jgi:hypothetical protein
MIPFVMAMFMVAKSAQKIGTELSKIFKNKETKAKWGDIIGVQRVGYKH